MAVPEQGPNPGTPHDLLRACLTLTAVAIALATFQEDILVERAFLFCGVLGAAGTGYALAQLWADSDMTSLRHLLFIDPPEGMGPRFASLVFLTWAMIGIVFVYVAMLITTVR